MSLVKLTIKGISYSQTQNGAYALILSEEDGERKLPIIIGALEAQAIAIALEKNIKMSRPLTHDLFKTFADRFDIMVKEIIIHKLVDGVFFSSIVCEKEDKVENIDARTSDAIAIALRFNAPIFTYQNILDKAGIFLNLNNSKEITEDVLNQPNPIKFNQKTDSDDLYSHKNSDDLHNLLDAAVNAEDYEKAAKIRDELSKR